MSSIYTVGRAAARLILSQYFSTITVVGSPCEHGPVIIVSNHQNHLLDALVIARAFSRPLWFLAKSTLFKGGIVNAVLHSAHLVPVYRRQDLPSSEDRLGKNEETFRHVIDRLKQGGAIVIFPEGTSLGERRLSPIKSGAARIALRTLDEHSGETQIRIQPVGITYSDLDAFRSTVTITFGEPIPVECYRSLHAERSHEAIHVLTAAIESSIRSLSVDIESVDEERLVEKISTVYQSLHGTVDDYQRLRLTASNVTALARQFPDLLRTVEKRVDDYLALLAVFSLPGSADLKADTTTPLFPWLVAPWVCIGVLLHYLPYRATGRLARRLARDKSEVGAFKLLLGTALFTGWYIALGVLTFLFTSHVTTTLFLTGAALCTGYIANHYLPLVQLTLLSALWPGRRNPLQVLRVIRKDLINELEQIRIE